jgi:hypothetical protein
VLKFAVESTLAARYSKSSEDSFFDTSFGSSLPDLRFSSLFPASPVLTTSAYDPLRQQSEKNNIESNFFRVGIVYSLITNLINFCLINTKINQ